MASRWHRVFGLGCISALVLCVSGGAPANTETSVAKEKKRPSFPIPPDSRPPGCNDEIDDPAGLDFADLKVSIIIPYKQETWEHIKGSLDSILYYTPKKYLSEIMFVSDGNSEEHLHIERIRSMAPKLISFLVFPEPGVGLIEAKMRAVSAVSINTTVLLFLEPHVRVNRHWLPPLLRRIREYPRVLAMPKLDLIPQDNFNEYYIGTHGFWRFEWNFNLAYTNPGNVPESTKEPFASPATSGGIFAIRKDWWDSLGFYDRGMIGWGGDHIEATLKVWRCGGHIDIIPCSRIGHLFRDAEHRPYETDVDQVVRNYGRIAAVWLDEYIDTFYKVKQEARSMDLGDLTEQRELRARLQCKDMKWYLENVDLEMNYEKDYVCVPGCSRQEHGDLCCEDRHPSRTAVDRVIPAEEYRTLELKSPTAEELRLHLHNEL